MEKKETNHLLYETPEIETVDIRIEHSFAESGHCEGNIDDVCNQLCQRD